MNRDAYITLRARQHARVAFSLPLVSGAGALFVMGLGHLTVELLPGVRLAAPGPVGALVAVAWIPGVWLAAALLYVVTRFAFELTATSTTQLASEPSTSTAAFARLPVDTAGSRAVFSVAVPMLALCMFLPVTIHWGLGVMLDATPSQFWDWLTTGVVLLGPANAALALMAVRDGVELVEQPLGERDLRAWLYPREHVDIATASAWQRAVGTVFLVACCPGVFAYGIPPAVAALSALVFVPTLWTWASRTAVKERTARVS